MSPSDFGTADPSGADAGSTVRNAGDVSGADRTGGPMSDPAGLVRMLNQIAANVAHHPHDQAVGEIAAHLRACWAPAMRAELGTHLERGGPGLTPLAAAAAERLQAETTRSSPA
jgi:formate dehydrogenase subunit delta